jgi:putative protease
VARQPLPPELLLPAGGFDSAIAAIDGGADALYLGFSDFSARKQAKNFDRLEYRRLYRFARDRGVKLYAALNTVILQEELEGAARILAFLGRFPPDAVIVQDWGLARLVKDRYPGIAIHASTQAGVQGQGAARVARELGASRVVLPRETSLAEMARACREAGELEFETFVHGALCYSFSGLCLASGLVLGRSGNRGECAQLCRSYYALEGKEGQERGAASRAPGRTGYWFSCRDLDLGDRVSELAAAGISSLKVEGRMKSPEYCFAVASLYRGLIDRLSGAGPGDEEIKARREAAQIAFARAPTEGWIDERGGASLIDSAYPGHRGVSAGRIVANEGGRLVLDLDGPLGLRDGLLGFEGGDPSRPVKFPALELRDARSGRELVRARAGSRVELSSESGGRSFADLRPGDELRRISSRELDRRAPSPEEYAAAREELPLRLEFRVSGLGAELSLPRFAGSGPSATAKIEGEGSLPLDRARAPGGLRRALELFDESGEADFRLLPELDEAAIVELSPGPEGEARSCAAIELFLPPSILKKEKNRIYARASELIAEAELSYSRGWVSACETSARGLIPEGLPPVTAPPRAALVFRREGLPSGLSFAGLSDLEASLGDAGSSALPAWGGRSWLPLAPLVSDREGYAAVAEEAAASLLDSGAAIAVGIGALHHVPIARSLRSRFGGAGSRLAFFLDVNLYVANDLAYASLASLVPGIEFAYRYLEIGSEAFLQFGDRIADAGPGFEPPLFQSLGCFLKHDIAKGVCPKDCSRAYSAVLSDRERRYRVLVEDCVTTVFRLAAARGRDA